MKEMSEEKRKKREETIAELRKVVGNGPEVDRAIQRAVEREDMHEEFVEAFMKEIKRAHQNYLKVCQNCEIPPSSAYVVTSRAVAKWSADLNELSLLGLLSEVSELQTSMIKKGFGKYI